MMPRNIIEESKGRLWLNENARPYIMMKKELAELYVHFKLIDDAVKEYFDILDLDTFDNLNIKSVLANLLLRENRNEDFENLTRKYW